ncbi:MAG: hypothetical protein JSV92_03750 [archaeon]|nr:MAG: hypothetical protein JSV92_03750 [archaeon]
MDEALVTHLKQMNLFPLEIDEEAQKKYREQGIDPSKIETHYNPGTPKHVIERCERIRKNVVELYGMDAAGKSGTKEYKTKEESVKKDLFELNYPTVEDVFLKLAELDHCGPFRGMTGAAGAFRDPFVPKTPNKDDSSITFYFPFDSEN